MSRKVEWQMEGWAGIRRGVNLAVFVLAGVCACRAPVEVTGPRSEVGEVEARVSGSSEQASTPGLEESRPGWHALWLVAGGTPPPGLPASLVRAREERAAIAVGLVRVELEGGRAEAFREELLDLLRRPETDDHLWCAAARGSARLGIHAAVDAIAEGLEAESGTRRAVASEALYALCGEWFTSAEGYEASAVRAAPIHEEHLAVLHSMTERLREHAAALYAFDLQRAEASLGAADPELRVAAAHALAQALDQRDAPNGLDPERVLAALIGRVRVEEDAHALHALIVDLLERLGPADVCSHDGYAFASALHARVAACDASLLAPLVYGLARMPLDATIETVLDEAGVPEACSPAYAVQALVGDATDSRAGGLMVQWVAPGRLVDTDALASALRSVESFFERAPAEARYPQLREVLLATIESPTRQASIRAGAVRVLARAGRPEDLGRLGAVLTSIPKGSTDELVAYELIAAIVQLVDGLGSTTEPAIAARDALAAMLSRDEESLRRRALTMLASDPLEDMAATIDAALLHDLLEQELPAQDSETVLKLLARRADPSIVQELLSSSAFERLMAPTSTTAAVLTETLSALSAGDSALTHEVARRLIASRQSDETAESEGVQRLRSALALMAALPESAATELDPEQHADIIRWSIELRDAAGSLSGVTSEDPPIAFLERLIELHLEARGQDPAGTPGSHHAALLHADLFAALQLESGHQLFNTTRGHFASAQERALKSSDPMEVVRVFRDRARFFSSAKDAPHALSDYLMVVTAEADLEVSAEASILDLADLRRAAAFAAASSTESGSGRTAFELTRALIQREFWKSEPATVRLEDLRALVVRSGASEADRADLRPLFAGIPLPGVDVADASLPPDALWIGLEANPGSLEALRSLAAQLEGSAPLLESPEPTQAPDGGTGEQPETPEDSSKHAEATPDQDPPADT